MIRYWSFTVFNTYEDLFAYDFESTLKDNNNFMRVVLKGFVHVYAFQAVSIHS